MTARATHDASRGLHRSYGRSQRRTTFNPIPSQHYFGSFFSHLVSATHREVCSSGLFGVDRHVLRKGGAPMQYYRDLVRSRFVAGMRLAFIDDDGNITELHEATRRDAYLVRGLLFDAIFTSPLEDSILLHDRTRPTHHHVTSLQFSAIQGWKNGSRRRTGEALSLPLPYLGVQVVGSLRETPTVQAGYTGSVYLSTSDSHFNIPTEANRTFTVNRPGDANTTGQWL
ncbi:hypothetical protein F5X96DRAFT_671218 [Biscogniauxia mediterranea]|nr:hypothetical protein F5X96DRAFT_671218 [Biscogniauxia mediterranea]